MLISEKLKLKLQSAEKVDLSAKKMRAADLESCVEYLIHNIHLLKLNLSCNNLDAEAGAHLARLLRHNAKLIELNLSNNRIRPAGLKILAEALADSTLEKLDLTFNGILYDHTGNKDKSGVLALLQALQKNQTLKVLNISNNILGNKFFEELIKILTKENNTLQEINFSTNCVKDKGVAQLLALLPEENKIQAQLWLHGNELTAPTVEKLKQLSGGRILGLDEDSSPTTIHYNLLNKVDNTLKTGLHLLSDNVQPLVKKRFT